MSEPHRESESISPGLLGHPLLHWGMLIGLTVMWGSSFGLTKIVVDRFSAEDVVAARLFIAALVLVFLVFLGGKAFPTNKRLWVFFLLMAVIGNCLPYWLISWGQQAIDSGLAGVLMAVMPLMTMVLAHLFVRGDQVTPGKTAGFTLGFLGVVILLGPENFLTVGSNATPFLAKLAMIAAAACYAINTIIARLCPSADSLVSAAGTVLAANLLFLPLFIGPVDALTDWQAVDATSIAVLVLLGVVSTALAPIVYFSLIRRAGPSFLSLINYLIPVWAMMVGIVFLGETPEWTAYAGMVVILGGVALSQAPVGQWLRRKAVTAAAKKLQAGQAG